MFQRNKNRRRSKDDEQFSRDRRQTKKNSTFNPKIHKMSSHGLGYQMKDGVKVDPKKFAGSVLKDILK